MDVVTVVALDNMLVDLVNSMSGFLQISPANVGKNIAVRHLFSHGINKFYLLHLRPSEVEERIRNDTIAKLLKYMIF